MNKNLIGRLAIRTKPVNCGVGVKDYSYTTEPIKILKITDSHIVYSHEETKEEPIFGKKIHILDSRWLDDNWIDYDELIESSAIRPEERLQQRIDEAKRIYFKSLKEHNEINNKMPDVAVNMFNALEENRW